MPTNSKPVIFLAFANDRERPGGYLRNLPGEAEHLRATLDAAAQAGLCEVLLRQNVTVEMLLDVFQDARYRNRIAIFHYGGHAGSYALLLETATGKIAIANAGGLATFLGQQTGIQLVFLNGCSTQLQTQELLDAGVAAVIATAQAIDDTVATEFAVRFYKGLASGATFQTAFHEAEAACQTAHGNQPRHLYLKEALSNANQFVADRWPWALTPRPGAERALQWSLPEAVNDPLFGLPPLPPLDLPDKPYRYLNWYRREDAAVFFGRGYDIRELYQRITAPDAPPITLYYGQSGVGKSSLLAAGLLPRLEQVQTVIYARRDQALGLAGTLATSLPGAAEAAGPVTGAELLDRWREIEAATGKPLTLILDQVEEVYTRPNAALPTEMDDFLDVLVALFGDRATRAQGRLILSFRKEWLAEIEKLVAERQLPRAKVFLQRLARRGIIETVIGPARSARLQPHFALTVAEGLAGEIADDLLFDPISAVTTTLQVLLSKLWEQAKQRNYDHPTFDRALYHELRRQGLLLSDFLEQQLAALREAQPGVVESGLVFDLLAFHTTPLGTAEQRTLAELRAAYAHQELSLLALLGACQSLYLLVDPAENCPDAEPSSRLAHDTLAPLVRHRFDESDAPGQRARRVLESRLSAEADVQATLEPLGEADLALVESGQAGMRAWRELEVNLIGLSRATRERRRKRERLIRGVLIALGCVIVVIAGVAFGQARRADREAAAAVAEALRADEKAEEALAAQTIAETEAEKARQAEANAVTEQARAERQAQIALARQLAAQAQQLMVSQPAQLSRTLLLAMESLRRYPERAANQVTAETLILLPREVTRVMHSAAVNAVAFSPDGQWIASAGCDKMNEPGYCNGGLVQISQAATGNPVARMSSHEKEVNVIAFSPDGRWLVSGSDDNTARVWEVATGREVVSVTHQWGGVNVVAFSADGQWILSSARDAARVWNAATGEEVVSVTHDLWVETAALSPDGLRLVSAGCDTVAWDTCGSRSARVWDISAALNTGLATKHEIASIPHFTEVSTIVFSPDGQWVASAEDLGYYIIKVWEATTGRDVAQMIHEDGVTALAFSPDGRWLLSSSKDGTARIWEAETGREAMRFIHEGFVSAVGFSPKGQWIVSAGGYGDSVVRVWEVTNGREVARLIHNGPVNAVAFSPNGEWIISGSADDTARIWDISQNLNPNAASSVETRVAHGWGPSAVVFSPDGQNVASYGGDGSVQVWETFTGRVRAQIPVDYASTLAFSPDGQWLVSTDFDGTRVWDVKKERPMVWIREGDIALNPDWQWIVSGAGSHIAHVWETATGDDVAQMLHQNIVGPVAFSADGLWVVSGSRDGVVIVWEAATGDEIVRMRHGLSVDSVGFSLDKQWVVSAGCDAYDENTTICTQESIRVWHVETGHEMARLIPDTYIDAAAFSTDGKWVYITRFGEVTQIWDISVVLQRDASSKPETVQMTPVESVKPVAFNADGSWLATAEGNIMRIWAAKSMTETAQMLYKNGVRRATFSQDGQWIVTAEKNTVQVWETSTGREMARITHEYDVNTVMFSPDSKWILSKSEDNTIRVWWWQPEDMIRLACQRLTRNLTHEEWQQYLGDEPYRCTCQDLPPHASVIEAGVAIIEGSCPVMLQP